jgi:hypothetical protein
MSSFAWECHQALRSASSHQPASASRAASSKKLPLTREIKTVRAFLNARLTERNCDTAELFAEFDAAVSEEANGFITKAEFLGGLRRMGATSVFKSSSAERLFVDDLYKELDYMGKDVIAFSEFHGWLLGIEIEPLRKARAIASWELTENEPEALRLQLRQFMDRDMIQVVDLFERWDANGDRKLRKREFLCAMKLLVGNECVALSHSNSTSVYVLTHCLSPPTTLCFASPPATLCGLCVTESGGARTPVGPSTRSTH